MPLTAPNRPTTAKIVDREFKRDLDAYLAPHGRSTAGIVAFNDAHPRDTLKFGQARLPRPRDRPGQPGDGPPTRPTSRPAARRRAPTSTRCWPTRGAPVDALLSLTAATAEVGVRAGYPQITVPMGYDATIRRPLALSFTGTAGDDAKLLGFAYAYEREAQIRRPPSEINPQTWHCVAPSATSRARCGPGELAPAEAPPVQVETPVGGTVPATLSLTLGAAGDVRRVHAGRGATSTRRRRRRT